MTEAPRPSAPQNELYEALADVMSEMAYRAEFHRYSGGWERVRNRANDVLNRNKVAESRPSAEEVEKMLIEEGWHISDGVDSCSGHDEDEMRESAKKIAEWLQERITRP